MSRARIRRCSEILEEHIVEAVQSRAAMRALLEEIAEVSAPDTGGPKILRVLARLGTPACQWFEGELRVEIVPDERGSVVRILSDNAGIRERVLPLVTLDVPFGEIVGALARIPKFAHPLLPRLTEDMLVLAPFHDDEFGLDELLAFADDGELAPILAPPTPSLERPSQHPTVRRMHSIDPQDFAIPTPLPPKPKPKQDAAVLGRQTEGPKVRR